MNCILDAEHGLVAATVQLHLAGHPKFQEVKKVHWLFAFLLRLTPNISSCSRSPLIGWW